LSQDVTAVAGRRHPRADVLREALGFERRVVGEVNVEVSKVGHGGHAGAVAQVKGEAVTDVVNEVLNVLTVDVLGAEQGKLHLGEGNAVEAPRVPGTGDLAGGVGVAGPSVRGD
jgi:hypothetical protein